MDFKLVFLLIMVTGIIPDYVNGQCATIGCCLGRDDDCNRAGCYCDEACFSQFNDCCPDFLTLCRGGNVSPFPRLGPMLGGTRIKVLGTFTGANTVSCIFGTSSAVPATIVSNSIINCVSPFNFNGGRMRLVITVNGVEIGRSNFLYQRPNQIPDTVTRVGGESWTKPGTFRIQWNRDLLDSTTVDVEVWAYSETVPGVPLFSKLYTIANGVLNGGSLDFTVPTNGLQIPMERMAAIRVVESKATGSVASLWSDVHVPQYLYPVTNGKGFCFQWFLDESKRGLDFISVQQACPCTLDAALIDSNSFSPDPLCDRDGGSNILNCTRKPGAVHCVRARTESTAGGGQECCYDGSGQLLNVRTSDGGGFSHRVHHSSLVPFFSNFWADIAPWFHCCPFSMSKIQCSFYKRIRRSQMCGGYVGPTMNWGGGDPHFLSLDGLQYTFNGLGEFLYVNIGDGLFIIQIRTGEVPGAGATAITAVAAKHNNSDTFHMEVIQNAEEVRILTGNETFGVDFSMNNIWESQGLQVRREGTGDETVVIAQFDDAFALKVSSNLNMLIIIFVLPESIKYLPIPTQGLLGIWNGNISDDLTDANGTLHSDEPEDIYEFGLSWIVPEEDALFYRSPGAQPPYSFPDFTPVFTPSNAQVDAQELDMICNGNEICEFDYLATGDAAIAQITMNAVISFEINENIIDEVEMNCESLSDILNGETVPNGNMLGDTTNYTCNDGFILSGSEITTCVNGSNSMPTWSDPPPMCLLNIAPVVNQCPDSWRYVNGDCYIIFNDIDVTNAGLDVPSDYDGRKRVCQSFQGSLAILEPYSTISPMIGFPADIGLLFAIGLDDRKQNGIYEWFDGTTPTQTNWATGQPSNNPGDDCVYVQSSTLQWVAAQCNIAAQFICQRHASRDDVACNATGVDQQTAIGYLLGAPSNKKRCVATLINSKWAVTSASCNGANKVVFGTTMYDKNPESIPSAQIRSFSLFPHAKYDTLSADYDIALILLDEAVIFGDLVNPMCIDTSPLPSFNSCVSSSWGNSINNDTLPSELQINDFIVGSECQGILDPFFQSGIKVCIGNFEQGTSVPCEQDTGAPLSCIDSSGKRVLVGVTADGFCTSSDNINTLEILTRVSTSYFLAATTENQLFDCAGNGVLINSQLCNNLYDCPSGDDEIGCTAAIRGSTFNISSPKFGMETNVVDITWLFRAQISTVQINVTFFDLLPESGSMTIGQGTNPFNASSLITTVEVPSNFSISEYMWIRYIKTSAMTLEGMQAIVTIN